MVKFKEDIAAKLKDAGFLDKDLDDIASILGAEDDDDDDGDGGERRGRKGGKGKGGRVVVLEGDEAQGFLSKFFGDDDGDGDDGDKPKRRAADRDDKPGRAGNRWFDGD